MRSTGAWHTGPTGVGCAGARDGKRGLVDRLGTCGQVCRMIVKEYRPSMKYVREYRTRRPSDA